MLANIKRYLKIKKSAKNDAKSVNSVDKVFGLEELVIKIFSFLDIHELIPLERVSKQFQLCADYWFRQQKTLSFNDNYCGIYHFMPDIDVIRNSYTFPLRYINNNSDGKPCLILNKERIIWLSKKLPNIEYLGIGHLETDYQTLYDILEAFQSIKWLEICDIKKFTAQEFRQLGQLLSGRVAKLNDFCDCDYNTKSMQFSKVKTLYLRYCELEEQAFVSLLKCFPSVNNEAKSVDKVFGLEELVIKIFSYLTIDELIGLERVSKQFQFCADYWLRQQKSIAFNEKFCGMDYNKPNIDVIHNSYTFPAQYFKTNSDGKQSLIKNKKRIILLSKKLPNIEYLGIGHFDTDYKTLCKVLNAFQSIKWLEMCDLCDFKDQELRLLGQLLSGRVTKLL
ncbi:unnamed protein product, partial [Medioppia subpectinata]